MEKEMDYPKVSVLIKKLDSDCSAMVFALRWVQELTLIL